MSDLKAVGFSPKEMMLMVRALSALNELSEDDDELDLITIVLNKIIKSTEAN